MRYVIAAALMISVAGNALASTAVYPVQTGLETARFRQGLPTLDLETPTGAIEITPMPLDHGHVAFRLGIYNKTVQPANFGIENVTATVNGQTVRLLTANNLERSAKNRAMWSKIGVAVLSGAAAAIVSNAHTTSTYSGSVRGVHGGGFSWASTYRDNTLGVVASGAAIGAGAAGIVGIQNRLDYTLANLAEHTIQTTTVDMDGSYAGRIVLDTLPPTAKLPYDVHLSINWNGTLYPFVFRVTDQGKAVPAPYTNAPTALVPGALAYAPTARAAGALAYAPAAGPAVAGVTVATAALPARPISPYELGRRQAMAALAATGSLPN